MPPEKYIELCYMYLKQGKWKQKTIRIAEDELVNYESTYKVLWKRRVLG